MKQHILILTLLSLMTVSIPVMATEMSHPAAGNTASGQMDIDKKINSSIMEMKQMRMDMSKAQGASNRANLMHEHMQMMKKGMQLMTSMGSNGMTEGQQGMMGQKANGRLQMMEKKLQMMQEMINGMIAQQEMMKNNN